jgi:hypothetical protein
MRQAIEQLLQPTGAQSMVLSSWSNPQSLASTLPCVCSLVHMQQPAVVQR